MLISLFTVSMYIFGCEKQSGPVLLSTYHGCILLHNYPNSLLSVNINHINVILRTFFTVIKSLEIQDFPDKG